MYKREELYMALKFRHSAQSQDQSGLIKHYPSSYRQSDRCIEPVSW